ncbi:lysozyme inhibitor LprI family protein [Pseudomonas indica]|uniref:lysozyme inhibitor LprI family protein n=1 Tax=Pseudomonas indica TaxID=137658 RepID=UPI000A04066D|nr:lysozyme inhibitor LprI family protein [Pseudomonas indica]MBU3057794.1 DUF1311 domain-containing protein [Pseudomonas indica]
MRKKTVFILLTTLSFCANAEVSSPCDSIESSQQIFLCSEHVKKIADNRLNTSYQEALRRIKNQYKNSADLASEYLSLLKESQRAWLKVRDKNCELEAFEMERGTEAHITTTNNCIARMSKSRANYLDKISPDI